MSTYCRGSTAHSRDEVSYPVEVSSRDFHTPRSHRICPGLSRVQNSRGDKRAIDIPKVCDLIPPAWRWRIKLHGIGLHMLSGSNHTTFTA